MAGCNVEKYAAAIMELKLQIICSVSFEDMQACHWFFSLDLTIRGMEYKFHLQEQTRQE